MMTINYRGHLLLFNIMMFGGRISWFEKKKFNLYRL